MLLRFAQGTWPPESSVETCVQALKESLQREQLGVGTVEQYLQHARQFLAHLDRQQIPLERASQQDIDSFIAERLRFYGKKHGRPPDRLVRWRCTYTPTIHRLLRDAQGQWPPPSAGDADLRRFEVQLVERGLGHHQVQVYRRHAREFLDYLNQRGISVAAARTADVDTYFRVALRVRQKAESESSGQVTVLANHQPACCVRLPAVCTGRMASRIETWA